MINLVARRHKCPTIGKRTIEIIEKYTCLWHKIIISRDKSAVRTKEKPWTHSIREVEECLQRQYTNIAETTYTYAWNRKRKAAVCQRLWNLYPKKVSSYTENGRGLVKILSEGISTANLEPIVRFIVLICSARVICYTFQHAFLAPNTSLILQMHT